jgi:hypothetical protein
MVQCLRGVDETPLKFNYLTIGVDDLDVAQLFKAIRENLNVENFHTFCEKMQSFITCERRSDETLIAYINRFYACVEAVKKQKYIAQAAGELVEIPRFFVIWRVLQAARRDPVYRPYIDDILSRPKELWFAKNPTALKAELERITMNINSISGRSRESDRAMYVSSGSRDRSASRGERDRRSRSVERFRGGGERERQRSRSVSRGSFTSTVSGRSNNHKKAPYGCPEDSCYHFYRYGWCTYEKKNGRACKYEHRRAGANEQSKNIRGAERGDARNERTRAEAPTQSRSATGATGAVPARGATGAVPARGATRAGAGSKPTVSESQRRERPSQKGRCAKCGGRGHQTEECHFRGVCNICKENHMARMCQGGKAPSVHIATVSGALPENDDKSLQ